MKENWEIHWKDYYKTLQTDPLAEPEVVKAAYDRLARKYHPDRNKEVTSVKRMTDLNEAFEILSNPEKRKRYYEAYLQKQAGSYRVDTSSYSYQPQAEAASDISPEVSELRWCPRCRDNTNMRIGFVNKRPMVGTCPRCQTAWDLRPQTHYTFPSEPAPDVKSHLEELRNIGKQSKSKRRFKFK
jgi:curved DNA-binding protein CbpA